MPARGIAIGIGQRNEQMAESPVSFPGFVAGTDEPGLQPLGKSFAAHFLGRYTRLGWGRAVGPS